jgi:hypothetical protein
MDWPSSVVPHRNPGPLLRRFPDSSTGRSLRLRIGKLAITILISRVRDERSGGPHGLSNPRQDFITFAVIAGQWTDFGVTDFGRMDSRYQRDLGLMPSATDGRPKLSRLEFISRWCKSASVILDHHEPRHGPMVVSTEFLTRIVNRGIDDGVGGASATPSTRSMEDDFRTSDLIKV